MNKNYYEILGVKKDASKEEIAAAYRKKALEYHPDRGGDPEKFKEVSEAFEVLNDPEKRNRHDNPMSSPGGSFNFGGFHSPFDIFDSIFGHQGLSGRRGIDIEKRLDVTFEEAALGCKKDVNITTSVRCSQCNGTGATSWSSCPSCGGSGRQTVRQSPFVMHTGCSKCKGVGQLPGDKCQTCNGAGISGTEDEVMSVTIPPGAFSGLRMKVAGKGEADENNYRGDLYLVVAAKKHHLFNRKDFDIICEIPVAYPKLVLGGEITVPTLHGEAQVKIKAGTQDGKKMRLAGMGVPVLQQPEQKGDMYVILRVAIPTDLDKNHRKLIEKLAEIEGAK